MRKVELGSELAVGDVIARRVSCRAYRTTPVPELHIQQILVAARLARYRISEFNLAAIGAVGGWPGGLLAMLLFRHNTAKLSFKLKYGLAFVLSAGLMHASLIRFVNPDLRLPSTTVRDCQI